jgi:Protein of unknown function (DUF4038)/Putative collagen-binding domain of a collagenase
MCVLWSVLGITAWLCASANAACTADCSHSKVAAFAAAQSANDAAPAYPLRISASGRYLVDRNNLPFLIVGDSPQSLINNLSAADREMYLADRQAHGFNTVWVNLLCNTYTGCKADGTTYDGVAPFTKPGDLAMPNETYFARADAAIRDAARHGLVVFLDPIETGGWLATLRANGAAKAFRYGAYLGQRYKDFPNIVWLSGNDFGSWTNVLDEAVVLAVANGIRSADPNHMQTIEIDGSSLSDPNWVPLAGLNAAYTYGPTYAEVLKGYNQSARVPVFLVEAGYEFEDNLKQDPPTPNILRRETYWTMTSGAAGLIYGNHYTWTFASGWQQNIDTIGVAELQIAKIFFLSYPWYSLVPDQDHRIIAQGYGTFAASGPVHTNDYATAARTPDGKLVIAYIPTVRPFSVDMSKLSGSATGRWFDPTSGRYRVVEGSPYANSGLRQFTPPGRNSSGESDWVLVLQAS